jgi:hypothetical protein
MGERTFGISEPVESTAAISTPQSHARTRFSRGNRGPSSSASGAIRFYVHRFEKLVDRTIRGARYTIDVRQTMGDR